MTTMTTMESSIPSKTESDLVENQVVTPIFSRTDGRASGESALLGLLSFDILLIWVILSTLNHPSFSYTVPWSADCLEGLSC